MPAPTPDEKPPEPTSTETPAPTPEPKEVGGRPGLDPVRYGDWEKGGIAVDF